MAQYLHVWTTRPSIYMYEMHENSVLNLSKYMQKKPKQMQIYKTFSMLNSNELEFSTAHKINMLKNKDFSRFKTLWCSYYPAYKC